MDAAKKPALQARLSRNPKTYPHPRLQAFPPTAEENTEERGKTKNSLVAGTGGWGISCLAAAGVCMCAKTLLRRTLGQMCFQSANSRAGEQFAPNDCEAKVRIEGTFHLFHKGVFIWGPGPSPHMAHFCPEAKCSPSGPPNRDLHSGAQRRQVLGFRGGGDSGRFPVQQRLQLSTFA